jgi:hypothetical protein
MTSTQLFNVIMMVFIVVMLVLIHVALIRRAMRVSKKWADNEKRASQHTVSRPKISPWVPMAKPIDQKHLGKLQEELAEAGAAAARCMIQGIDAVEPDTGKPNRQWLEEELADVLANSELVEEHWGLDIVAIRARADRKKAGLRVWHGMLAR